MEKLKNVLLITGPPGIGKTTCVSQVYSYFKQKQQPINFKGFITQEIRNQKNYRVGFKLIDISSQSEDILAHIDFQSNPKVGKYGVNVSAIDKFSQNIISQTENQGDTIYLVDEIGKMECFSKLFIKTIQQIISNGGIIVATIALKGEGFISQMKLNQGADLIQISENNREYVKEQVIKWIETRIKASQQILNLKSQQPNYLPSFIKEQLQWECRQLNKVPIAKFQRLNQFYINIYKILLSKLISI